MERKNAQVVKYENPLPSQCFVGSTQVLGRFLYSSDFFSFDRICFLGPTSFRGTYLGAHEEQRPPQHPNGVPWEGTTAAPTAALGAVLLEAAAAWRTRRISKGLHNYSTYIDTYIYMCVCDLWYSVECCGVMSSLHVHSLFQPATLLFWSWHASCL